MDLKHLRASSALLLAICMLVSLSGASAFAASKGKPTPKPTPDTKSNPSPKEPRGCHGTSVFSTWGDANPYILMTSADFERGSGGFEAKGGARLVAGNESFFAHARSDTHSLALRSGSSVTLHAKCVGMLHPLIRFFARNTGDASAKLRVTVSYRDRRAVKRTVRLGDVSGSSDWAPSDALTFLNARAALVTQSSGNIAVTFAPVGTAGAWQIDDVYIDPYKLN